MFLENLRIGSCKALTVNISRSKLLEAFGRRSFSQNRIRITFMIFLQGLSTLEDRPKWENLPRWLLNDI